MCVCPTWSDDDILLFHQRGIHAAMVFLRLMKVGEDSLIFHYATTHMLNHEQLALLGIWKVRDKNDHLDEQRRIFSNA